MTLQLKRLFDRIENLPIGWAGIGFSGSVIILIRAFLENILDKTPGSSYWTAIFAYSWFLSLFIALIFLLAFTAGVSRLRSARLLLIGFLVILIPPLSFLFGFNRYFEFPHGTWSEIFFHIATFFAFYKYLGPFFALEIILVITAMGVYFFIRKNFLRSLVGVLITYLIIVCFALQGKLFGYTANPITGDPLFNLSTNFATSQFYAGINFLLFLFLGLILFLKERTEKAKNLFFNLRPGRIISVLIFMTLAGLGALSSGYFYFPNFILSFFLFSVFLFYAALSNDVADLKIDKVSNPNRPYARGIFSKKEMSILQTLVLLAIAILVLIIDSMPILIITAINIGLSILYSVFRFRKFLFSHLIAAAGESTVVLYGYFAQMPTSSFALVEAWILFFAVFVFLAFFLPIKDLKDFAGDKKENVRNFLTVFSWRSGKILTAISVSLAYIFFAFIMGSPAFFVLSFFFAGLGAYFVVYYEKVGERASYINFLAFIVLFLLFSVA